VAGELKYCKNGRRAGTLMHVDCSLPLWAFFDMYGTTNKLESLGKMPLPTGIHVCRQVLIFIFFIDTACLACREGSMTWWSICPSVHHFTTAAACGGFAAKHCMGRRYRLTVAGADAQQQCRRSMAFCSKRRQCHIDSRFDEVEHRLVVMVPFSYHKLEILFYN